jgi:hypothetical protein
MSVHEIPKSFVYACDCCGRQHVQENANGHYSDSRPSGWARLIFRQGAEDFQGAEVADASIERLLCRDCRSVVGNAINDATAGIKSKGAGS